jgi:hypothetical protein
VRSAIEELSSKASRGTMEVDELVQAYHDINERMGAKKLFDELSTTERRKLKSRYDLVKREIGNELQQYGRTNPEFYKTWRQANEGHAAIAQSKGISNFISSKSGKLPHHLAASIAIDLFMHSGVATGSVISGYALAKTGELMYRVARSPTLRRHYQNVLMEASNENLPGMIKNLESLDKGLKSTQHKNQGKPSQSP